jgi:hypothetical protein
MTMTSVTTEESITTEEWEIGAVPARPLALARESSHGALHR